MAEATPPLISDFLECPICLEKYQIPRALPCLHTFCEVCLDSFIQSNTQDGSVFFCPICRKPTAPLKTKLKVEEWARSFPLNHMIVSLMNSNVKRFGCKTPCDACRNRGQEVTAEIWCEDCAATFCRECHDFHQVMPIACGHKTMVLGEKLKCETKIHYFDEGCPHHRNKIVEVFCLDHRELCCVICFATGHRGCKNIKDIDDISKEEHNKSAISYFKNNMLNIKAKTEKVVAISGKNIDRIDEEKSSLEKDMESMVSHAKRKLDQLLRSYTNKVSEVHAQSREQLVSQQKQARGFIANIENSYKVMDVVLQRGSSRQIFLTFEQLRSQIKSHFHQLKTVFGEGEELSITVQVEDIVKTFTNNLKLLGTVQISTAPSSIGDIISEVDKMMSCIADTNVMAIQAQEEHDNIGTSVTLIKAIPSKELETPFLTAGTFLRNENLLLVDRRSGRLIVLNEELKAIRSHEVHGTPSNISQAKEDDKVWLSYSDKKVIHQYEAKNDLILLSSITLNDICFGVDDGVDAVIVRTQNTIDYYSKNGSQHRSIRTTPSSGYITMSSKTRAIYHFDGPAIICRDKSDNKLFTYQTKSLGRLRGMALDTYDNVYMCGKDTGKVYKLSADGKTCSILINKLKGISIPECIMFHPRKNLFAVTSFKQNTALEVYNFNQNCRMEDKTET